MYLLSSGFDKNDNMNKFLAQAVCLNYEGGVRAIRQFELDFKGRVLAIYGDNYSGKTSLIKSMCGLEKFEGEFILDDINLKQIKNDHKVFALLEDFSLIPKKTVFDNLAYPLKIRGISQDEIDKIVKNALYEFGIEKYADIKVKKLSNKLRAYVGMAKIQLRPAKIYIFDDILKYLEGEEKEICIKKLQQIFAKLNGLIIFATSNYDEAKIFGDKIAVLYGGIIEQYGTANDIANSPSSVYITSLASNFETKFKTCVLKADDTTLVINYNNSEIILDNTYRNRLISDDFINCDVFVAEYENNGKLEYLIMDTETEKTILK